MDHHARPADRQSIDICTYCKYISIKVNVAFYSLEILWFNELSENPIQLVLPRLESELS